MLKLKTILSLYDHNKLFQIKGAITFLFFRVEKITVAFRLGEAKPPLTSCLTPFTFICQLRPRGEGWQAQATGRGA